jgi:hypothetical protein
MRCNIKNKQLPANCPKCGKRLINSTIEED